MGQRVALHNLNWVGQPVSRRGRRRERRSTARHLVQRHHRVRGGQRQPQRHVVRRPGALGRGRHRRQHLPLQPARRAAGQRPRRRRPMGSESHRPRGPLRVPANTGRDRDGITIYRRDQLVPCLPCTPEGAARTLQGVRECRRPEGRGSPPRDPPVAITQPASTRKCSSSKTIPDIENAFIVGAPTHIPISTLRTQTAPGRR